MARRRAEPHAANCAHCHRITALKNGKLARHKTDQHHDRDGNRLWCPASGTVDWYRQGDLGTTWRLEHQRCYICHRSVGLDPDSGVLLPHLYGDQICDGSGDPGYVRDDSDNFTNAGSSFGWGPAAINEDSLPTPEQDLADWWRQRCEGEIDMVVAKAIEYGATDLRDLGRIFLEMCGREAIDDAYATEAGIAFYAQGKLARIVAAIREGRRPSFDSWLDLGVYARMAQRVHDRGGWPGV
jgi:mono/diheme cytochrome c family protein